MFCNTNVSEFLTNLTLLTIKDNIDWTLERLSTSSCSTKICFNLIAYNLFESITSDLAQKNTCWTRKKVGFGWHYQTSLKPLMPDFSQFKFTRY